MELSIGVERKDGIEWYLILVVTLFIHFLIFIEF